MPGLEQAGGSSPKDKGRSRLFPVLKMTGVALGAAALMFALGFGLFATHVSRLVTPTDQAAADAIIVVTGGQSRIDAGLKLLESGKGRRLLISGVNPIADSGDLQAATGGDKRLFSCCVDIDHAALDTIGNAQESAKWIEDHRYESVILVTNNYHMPRALLEMSRFLDSAELSPYPVVNTRLDGGVWATRPEALRVLFTEYNKYLVSVARGVVPVRPSLENFRIVEASTTN